MDREPGYLGRIMFGAGTEDPIANVSSARRRYARRVTISIVAAMATGALVAALTTRSLPWILLAGWASGMVVMGVTLVLDVLGLPPPPPGR